MNPSSTTAGGCSRTPRGDGQATATLDTYDPPEQHSGYAAVRENRPYGSAPQFRFLTLTRRHTMAKHRRPRWAPRLGFGNSADDLVERFEDGAPVWTDLPECDCEIGCTECTEPVYAVDWEYREVGS